jgi:hypothetical protein
VGCHRKAKAHAARNSWVFVDAILESEGEIDFDLQGFHETASSWIATVALCPGA